VVIITIIATINELPDRVNAKFADSTGSFFVLDSRFPACRQAWHGNDKQNDVIFYKKECIRNQLSTRT